MRVAYHFQGAFYFERLLVNVRIFLLFFVGISIILISSISKSGSQQYAALFAVNEPSDGHMIIKRRLDSKEDFCDST